MNMSAIKLPNDWKNKSLDELELEFKSKKMIEPPVLGGGGSGSNKTGAKPKAKRKPSLSHVCHVCDYKYDRPERLSAHMFNKHAALSSTTTTQFTTGQPIAVVEHLQQQQQQQQQQEFVCPLGMFVYYGEQVEEVEQVEQVEEAEEAEDPLAA